MSETLKAVFFDFDGTLADSVRVLQDAYLSFLDSFGRQGTQVEFESLSGPPLPEIVFRLKDMHDLPGTPAQLLDCYEALVANYYSCAGVMPGAPEILAYAESEGLSVGIVTSGKAGWVEEWLVRSGITASVDFIVDRNATPRGKPFPDPYLEALRRSGHAVTATCAVEDSLTGAHSARGAGLKTYVVGSEGKFTGAPEGVDVVSDLFALLELWEGNVLAGRSIS